MNCSRRHDFPTPKSVETGTCVADDDKFEHVRKRHGLSNEKFNNEIWSKFITQSLLWKHLQIIDFCWIYSAIIILLVYIDVRL